MKARDGKLRFVHQEEVTENGRQNNSPEIWPHLNPWNLLKCYLTWQKKLQMYLKEVF